MPEAPGIKRAAPPDKPPAGAVHQLNQLNRPEPLTSTWRWIGSAKRLLGGCYHPLVIDLTNAGAAIKRGTDISAKRGRTDERP
jgi:hypothetical protein